MKTVMSIETLELEVTSAELIEDKWLSLTVVSKKIAEYEKANQIAYKAIRTRLYNSTSCGKYNTEVKAGMKCIDIDSPMKSTASLVLSFKRV